MPTGQQLKEAREAAGLNQEQVANALGLHRLTIVTWEGKAYVDPRKAARFMEAVARLAPRAA